MRPPSLFDRRATWWVVSCAAAAALLVPLFVVDVPPLLDYPNHMARMHVLAFGPGDPILSFGTPLRAVPRAPSSGPRAESSA